MLFAVLIFLYMKNVFAPTVEREPSGFEWKYLWLIPATFYIVWHSAFYGVISRAAPEIALRPKDTLFLSVVNADAFHVYYVISRLITEERDLTPITDNTLRLMFRRLKTQANIPRIRAHLLRHTFATNFLQNGGDIYTLQQILGHTSLEMVKRYVHFTPVKMQSTHAKYSPLDKVLKA